MFTYTGTNWYIEHIKRVGLAAGLDCNTFRLMQQTMNTRTVSEMRS